MIYDIKQLFFKLYIDIYTKDVPDKISYISQLSKVDVNVSLICNTEQEC